MLARLLNDWPLRQQILVATGVAILLVTLGAAEYVRHLQTRALEQTFEEQSRKLVAMLAGTSLDAILSEDRPVLNTMVSQLASVDPQVEKISIFNEDDLMLSSWSREASGWKLPLAPRLHFSQNVSLADETFGRIAVTWNVAEQQALIRRQTGTIYRFALAIALLLGLMLLLLLDAIIVKPLRGINDYTNHLHKGRVQGPLQLAGARELNDLAGAVNELGGMLDLRASIAQAMGSSHPGPGVAEKHPEQPAFADLTRLDLEELVEDTVAELAGQAHAKGLEISTFLTDDVPRQASGDRTRIHQVLCTLVTNAVRFTSTGEVRVHVECVKDAGTAGTLRFSVIDTGIGIDARLRQRIFDSCDPQDRSAGARVANPGLSICRQLVEGMGGLIGVDSQPGQGSVFWFELALPEAIDVHVPGPEPALAGRRILLVESHRQMRERLLGILGFHGMLVDCEASAEAGLSCLREACNADRLHDIVLFDSELSDMPGNVFTRCIEADPVFDSLCLLSMVRHCGSVDASQLRQDARLEGVICRPVRRRELTRLLLRALGEDTQTPAADAPTGNDGSPRKAA